MAQWGRDLASGLALVAGGAGLFVSSSQLPAGTASDPVGPRGFPTLLAFGLIGCGLALLVGLCLGARSRARSGGPGPYLNPDQDEDHGPLSPTRLSGGILLTAAYVASLQQLGFMIGTPLYLAGLLWLQGGVPRRQFLLTVLGYPLVLYALFGLLLSVPFPGGLLERLLY